MVEREGRAGWEVDRGCRWRRPERIDRRDERQRRRLYAARAAEAVVHVSRRFGRGQRLVALTDGRRDGVRDKPEGIQRAQAGQGKIQRGPPKEDHGNNPKPGAKRFSSHVHTTVESLYTTGAWTPRAPVLFRRLALLTGSPHPTPGATVLPSSSPRPFNRSRLRGVTRRLRPAGMLPCHCHCVPAARRLTVESARAGRCHDARPAGRGGRGAPDARGVDRREVYVCERSSE